MADSSAPANLRGPGAAVGEILHARQDIERYSVLRHGQIHNADHTAKTANIITTHKRADRPPIIRSEAPRSTLVSLRDLARCPGRLGIDLAEGMARRSVHGYLPRTSHQCCDRLGGPHDLMCIVWK